MDGEKSLKSCEAYPMNGGDGPNSYTKNSSLQRAAMDTAKEFIKESIANKFDIKKQCFRIADLGCSVGPNTFFAIQIIIEAIIEQQQQQQQQLEYHKSKKEFQVFFNDKPLNDFNTLFKSLPPNRQYYAVGVPGSFYGPLFPRASLHLVYSSCAINWLSKVPEQVMDRSSRAWNKGRIHYTNSADEVGQSYSAQFMKDMECFLHAREQEVVYGGLVLLILPVRPNSTSHSKVTMNVIIGLLESCLIDMAKKGKVSEEIVDSFNVPAYHVSPEELESVIKRNGCFSIERMESLPRPSLNPNDVCAEVLTLHLRAATEGLIKEHFGSEILDELFNLFCNKVKDVSFSELERKILFVLLKRKANE